MTNQGVLSWNIMPAEYKLSRFLLQRSRLPV
jgi:hypothetical protein